MEWGLRKPRRCSGGPRSGAPAVAAGWPSHAAMPMPVVCGRCGVVWGQGRERTPLLWGLAGPTLIVISCPGKAPRRMCLFPCATAGQPACKERRGLVDSSSSTTVHTPPPLLRSASTLGLGQTPGPCCPS